MIISANKETTRVSAADVRFDDVTLIVVLSDGREVHLPMQRLPWLQWLANATAAQRANWSVEPNGFAIYWEELDDGIEVSHLLDPRPLDQ